MKTGEGVVARPDTLPGTQLLRIQEVAQDHGFDLSPLATKLGLASDLFSNPNNEISSADYYRLLEYLLQVHPIPAFGFRVGRKYSIADYGVLGYAIMSSPTLAHALEIFFKYQPIVGAGAGFTERFRVEGDEAIITVFSDRPKSAELYRFDIEESIGQWTVSRTVRAEAGEFPFTRINFAFPRPRYAQLIEDALSCRVNFDQGRNELVFPSELLRLPLRTANEVAAEICQKQCESILGGFPDSGSIVEKVKRLIVNRPGKSLTPEEIADHLHLSYRTLRRRLQEHNTTLKRIRDEVNVQLAMDYLAQSNLSIQEIAFLLNYSEAANFHRAFRSLVNMTPLEYRRRVRSAEPI